VLRLLEILATLSSGFAMVMNWDEGVTAAELNEAR